MPCSPDRILEISWQHLGWKKSQRAASHLLLFVRGENQGAVWGVTCPRSRSRCRGGQPAGQGSSGGPVFSHMRLWSAVVWAEHRWPGLWDVSLARWGAGFLHPLCLHTSMVALSSASAFFFSQVFLFSPTFYFNRISGWLSSCKFHMLFTQIPQLLTFYHNRFTFSQPTHFLVYLFLLA